MTDSGQSVSDQLRDIADYSEAGDAGIIREGAALLDDMAEALLALRRWMMDLAEHHDGMDTGALSSLIGRAGR